MTRAQHRRLYDKAYRAIHVKPLMHISIHRLGRKWGWRVVDINASSNGRCWCVSHNEGYDDPESALVDAKEAFLKAEQEVNSQEW
jgi:hypothetical protein